jgi:hypothetical protein
MRAPVLFLCVLGYAVVVGCGSVGEPLYPAVHIPTQISDLTAVERGSRIDVTFTIPPLTTEGLTLTSIGSVDLRVGPNASPTFQPDQWSSTAQRISDVATPAGPGFIRAPVPAQQFIGQDVVIAVRIGNSKGRFSSWSNPAVLHVGQPVATPAGLKAEASAQGVELTWTAAPDVQFRLYRKAAEEKQPSLLGSSGQPNYLDSTAEYGKAYEYYVEGVHEKAVSDTAGPVAITPKDTFPPAVPAALTASAGLGAVELAWERNTESDFKEYRVFRAEGAGAFSQIADGLVAPSYSDRGVDSGKHYRYRVAAVDQAGNASEPSNPVEVTAP